MEIRQGEVITVMQGVGTNLVDQIKYQAPSQYKDGLSRYGDSHGRDTVLYLTWDPYTGKTISLYWDGPKIILVLDGVHLEVKLVGNKHCEVIMFMSNVGNLVVDKKRYRNPLWWC